MNLEILPRIWYSFFKPLLQVTILTGLLISSFSCSAKKTHNSNSIGVYGGSISYLSEADSSKMYWQKMLNIPTYTFSESGGGFTHKSIALQVKQSPSTDYVIFWCSTNDFNSTTENENNFYDSSTQNGGIRLAYQEVIRKNPRTIVLLLTSLPCFDGRNGSNSVEGQIKVSKELKIPYLDQFTFFSANDVAEFYMPDKVHLKANAYIKIRDRQLEFIRQNIQK